MFTRRARTTALGLFGWPHSASRQRVEKEVEFSLSRKIEIDLILNRWGFKSSLLEESLETLMDNERCGSCVLLITRVLAGL